jgi:hypothetical protein
VFPLEPLTVGDPDHRLQSKVALFGRKSARRLDVLVDLLAPRAYIRRV